MKLKVLFLSWCLFFYFLSKSQNGIYSVVNAHTQKNIHGVYIYTQKKYTLTDSLGQFKIEGFKPTDTLYFQHINYNPLALAIQDLKNPIYLIPSMTQLKDIVISDKWHILEEAKTQEHIILTKQNIIFEQVQTSADLLGSTGQISIQKSQQGGGSPMLRGFAANRILLILDGIRLNNAIYRSGNLQNIISLDAHSMEKVEVLFGSSSLLYGSDGLGGAVTFETFRPKLLSENNNKFFSGQAFTRYTNSNHEKTGHLSFNLSDKKIATFTSFTWNDFDNLRSGKKRKDENNFGKNLFYVEHRNGEDTIIYNLKPERQIYSAYRQWNILQKINFQITDKLNLIYGFYYTSSSNIPRYDQLTRLTDNLPRSAIWYYGPQKWQLHHISLFYEPHNVFIDDMQIILAYQRLDEDRFDRRFRNKNLRQRFENVYIGSINMNIKKYLTEQKHCFFYGLEIVYNRIHSKAFLENIYTKDRIPTLSRYPNGGNLYYNTGFYFEHKWQIKRNMMLNTGLRYNHILLYTKFTNNDLPFNNFNINTGAWSGGSQYVFSPRSWLFKVGLSTAFRAPNLDDIAKVFESGEGRIVVPNPRLAPEYSYQLEISIEKKWSNNLSFKLINFYNLLDDIMVRRNFSFNGQEEIIFNGERNQVQAVVNGGKAYIWGLSAKLKYRIFETFTLTSFFTYLKSKELGSNNMLRHVAPPFGKTMLSFNKSIFRLALTVQYSQGIDFEDLAPSERDKPYLYSPEGALSWWTFNFKAQINLNQGWRILFNLENLFDRHYRTYSSGISAGGRALGITVYKKL